MSGCLIVDGLCVLNRLFVVATPNSWLIPSAGLRGKNPSEHGIGTKNIVIWCVWCNFFAFLQLKSTETPPSGGLRFYV
jgi:hypothetical protein